MYQNVHFQNKIRKFYFLVRGQSPSPDHTAALLRSFRLLIVVCRWCRGLYW